MDDVAGCRLIFPSIDELYSFRETFHAARFGHKLRNDQDKYDYIKAPKKTGYRGVHDIYEYNVSSEVGRSLKGLLVEIQYRTEVQHSWATAVEVIGFITESQPKFEAGDKRYQEAMAFASEIIARTYEGSNGPHPKLSDKQLVKYFLALDQELGLLKMLRGLNAADKDVSDNKNTILIFGDSGHLEIRSFRDATDALRKLFELEALDSTKDIVLVRADTSEEVRFAFKNYFSDARDFIRLIEDGCQTLSGRRLLSARRPSRRKKRKVKKKSSRRNR